jgi:hypothetical protein
MNGNRYQEPVPDLIDGQPEWEVEGILGARKRRHQLQYLVRWKGFSEAHDSWEPLMNINADNLIKQYYEENPLAVRNTYKTPLQHSPIIIQNISIMSNASSPPSFSLTNSPEPVTPTYPDSPPAIPIPPPLSERISDPPVPLTLMQQISSATLEEVIATCERELGDGPRGTYNDPWRSPMYRVPPPTPPPIGIIPPTGYTRYDPADLNHSKYVRKIALNPFIDEPVSPHYVQFYHDFCSHQHYVHGMRDDANPPNTAYRWPLEAVPFIGPPLSPAVANNEVLNLLDTRNLDARSVDAALYALDDYGLTADVDRYRHSMTEYEALLARQSILDRDFYVWRSKSTTLCKRLHAGQARSRLHPYLSGQEWLPAPPGYLGSWNTNITAPPSLSMDEALAIDIAAGSDEEERPWFHGRFGVAHRFRESTYHRCPYCRKSGHTNMQCTTPHALCHTTISCIIPSYHRHFGANCPAANHHLTDNNDEEAYHPAEEGNPALEDEGYVGHRDEEGDSES